MSTLWIVFLVEMILQSASAIPGYHTAGKEFVFGCPNVRKPYNFGIDVRVIVNTDMYSSDVDIWMPTNYYSGGHLGTPARLTIGPKAGFSYVLDKQCSVLRSGIFTSYRLNASSPVYVLLAVEDPVLFLVIIRAIPKETCFNKYYVTTSKNRPFLTVHAFNHCEITARFPDTNYFYRQPCFGDHKIICRPNTVVAFHLEPYQFWHFTVDDFDSDLQNTVIESDNPVFVMAGNAYINFSRTRDSLASTMKPVVAWGKLYIVPHFFGEAMLAKLALRINAKKFPFRFNFTHGSTKELVLQTAGEAEYVHATMSRPVVVTANTPFGLHAIMATTYAATQYTDTLVGSSLINIIPVEQWMNGFIRHWNYFDRLVNCSFTFFVFSTVDPKHVVFRRYANSPNWTKFVTIQNTTFYYTTVQLKDINEYIYVNNRPGKLMLYVRIQPNEFSSSAVPCDFYQGEIATATCAKVKPVVSDGVDNDCDGVIDEEINNGIDDDGDGEVDEDIIEDYVNGHWLTEKRCYIRCKDTEEMQFVRECVRSRFGLPCTGKTEGCETTVDCPTSCNGSELQRNCTCNRACSKCKHDTAVCDQCVPGYYQSPYCLRKCPRGWGGVDCHLGPRSIKDLSVLDNRSVLVQSTTPTSPEPSLGLTTEAVAVTNVTVTSGKETSAFVGKEKLLLSLRTITLLCLSAAMLLFSFFILVTNPGKPSRLETRMAEDGPAVESVPREAQTAVVEPPGDVELSSIGEIGD